MLKKLFLLTFAAFALAACNDDKDDNGMPAGYHYATENPYIVDGLLTGRNMHFFGTSTATAPDGSVFVDDKAYFEFAGGDERVSVYMHATRFVGNMPAMEMKIPQLDYQSNVNGNAIAFTHASIIPEALLPGATGYQTVPKYVLTNLNGWVDGIRCNVKFNCIGFQVVYEGRLIDNN